MHTFNSMNGGWEVSTLYLPSIPFALIVWVMDTPSVGQDLFGKQMRKGASSLKKCSNVISVQHLRTSSCHGAIAPIGPYLQELVISPWRAKHWASLLVSWEEFIQKITLMSFLWPPLFGWMGKLRYDRHSLSSRILGYQQGNTPVELPLYPLFSVFPKHLHIHFSQPRLNYLVYKPKSRSHKWLVQDHRDSFVARLLVA